MLGIPDPFLALGIGVRTVGQYPAGGSIGLLCSSPCATGPLHGAGPTAQLTELSGLQSLSSPTWRSARQSRELLVELEDGTSCGQLLMLF